MTQTLTDTASYMTFIEEITSMEGVKFQPEEAQVLRQAADARLFNEEDAAAQTEAALNLLTETQKAGRILEGSKARYTKLLMDIHA